MQLLEKGTSKMCLCKLPFLFLVDGSWANFTGRCSQAHAKRPKWHKVQENGFLQFSYEELRCPNTGEYSSKRKSAAIWKVSETPISAAIYRGAKCPTLNTAGRKAEKGAEWVTVNKPKNRRKDPKNNQNCCFSVVSAVFLAVFRDVLP